MTKREKFIINALREATIKWDERNRCFNLNRRQVKEGELVKGGDKLKWYWKCQCCGFESRNQDDFQVDHIVEVGAFDGDWNNFINRLFCSQKNLQLLCITCHAKKTSKNASLKHKRKIDRFYEENL